MWTWVRVASTNRQRANIYVDGFNFYYGCFANPHRPTWSAYKWIDLGAYFTHLFPNYQIGRIRYFTALIDPPPTDPDQRNRQLIYLRALRTIPYLTVHEGRFATHAKWRWEADPASFLPPFAPIAAHPVNRVAVIEQEEKGSDVNLASYLLVDGFQQEYDVAIVVSNDSDLAEPIRLVKSVLGLRVGLLNPRKKTASDLQRIADFYRTCREGALAACQFPHVMHDTSGIITKPSTW
jgi:uncharacterized LabA/DUF88 family protein